MGVIKYFVLLLSFPTFIYSQAPTTTGPLGCPGGGVAYQDIAILYELSYYPDNTTLTFSQQIANAIAAQLFAGPTYQYFDANGVRATQITPIAFPNTLEYNIVSDDYNYGVITSNVELTKKIGSQLHDATLGFTKHPIDSTISE